MFSQLNAEALQDLLARDMSRREFLLYVAGVVVGMIGISNFIQNLLHQNHPEPKTHIVTSNAYGGGSYSPKDTSSTKLGIQK